MALSVDEVIVTAELTARARTAPDSVAEAAALHALAAGLNGPSEVLLQTLLDSALTLCRAGSSGVSLQDGDVFRWIALAGQFAGYVGGTTPVNFSPCGTCLDRGAPQLYRHPARAFTYLEEARPPIVEGLVIPFRAPGLVGTIWVVSHDDRGGFTAEDLRIMVSLAGFTAAAVALQQNEARCRREAEQERAGRRESDAANQAKEQFLATLSHELRVPMNAILGWSEMLMNGLDETTAGEAIVSLYLNASRQARLVDEMLDVAGIDAGRVRVRFEEVDLVEIARRTVRLIEPAGRGRAAVRFRAVGGHCTINGDRDRLEQIVVNLLSNALRVTPWDGVIDVTVTSTGRDCELNVEDSGPGIAPDLMPGLFDGLNLRDSESRKGARVGLGLVIVRKLVEMHGGTIAAGTSALGGARFVVRLPTISVEHGESVADADGARLAWNANRPTG